MSDPATERLSRRIGSLGRDELRIRRAEDADGPALTALVGAAYDEYACGPLDPRVFDADLAAPARMAKESGRSWWVVVRSDPSPRLVASVAHGPLRTSVDDRGRMELHRLYLAPEVRRVGLATCLLEGIVEEARRIGATTLIAWSDTRLPDAHRRYLAFGFRLTGERRELGDPAGTTELEFALPLEDGSGGPAH